MAHRRLLSLLVVLGALALPACSAVAPTTGVAIGTGAPSGARQPTGSSFVTAAGTQLRVDGQPYQVVSLNAYELGTAWGTNAGCGSMLDDAALDAFFAALPSRVMVRIWGFQGSMATNVHTRQRDWGPLDRVVNAAARHGQRLIISLGDQGGVCDDDHWKDRAWYQGGYRTVYPGNGYNVPTVSYWDWVHEIATRYRDSTTVAMWELVNEPEASDCLPGAAQPCHGQVQCPDQSSAAAALRNFFDTVGTELKRIDPNHLVESGALGGPQCGWVGANSVSINASPGIDVTSYHDYLPNETLPAELSAHLAESRTLNKPLLVGELGVQASGTTTGCSTFGVRSERVAAKVNAMLAAGVAGVLFWSWVPDPQSSTCTYDIGPGDPLLGTLRA